MVFGRRNLFADAIPSPWARGQGMGCREFIVLAAPSSSHSSSAPVGDSSPKLSQVGLSHVLNSSPFAWSSVLGEQAAPAGSLRGSQILPESCSSPQNLDTIPIQPQASYPWCWVPVKQNKEPHAAARHEIRAVPAIPAAQFSSDKAFPLPSAGEKLNGIQVNPRSQQEMRENVEKVLQFVASKKIRMHQTSAKGTWPWG